MSTVGSSSTVWTTMATTLAYMQSHFVVLVVSIFYLRWLIRRYASPLRRFPGPFVASCSRVWKMWSVYRGHTEMDHVRLHEKYGPVVRVAPNELSFASPNAAKDIFAVGKGFTKTEFYKVFPPSNNPDIFTEIREWKHAQMKRYAATPYSLASMQKLTPFIEDVERTLMQKLDRFASDDQVCDLGNFLHWFAFDVIGEVAFSQRYGFVAEEKDVGGTIKFIDDIQWYDGIIGQIPEYHKFLRDNPAWQYLQYLTSQMPFLTGMALGEIQKRKQSGGLYISAERKDLLGQLMQAHAANPEKFSELDVFSVAHGAIGAGADSTASTMQSFFHFVLSHPQVYTKLTQEIRQSLPSPPGDAMTTYTQAQDLPYFQACLKEAMRLRPALGLNLQRYVPQGGTSIDGTHYAGGTVVSVNSWVVHRDRSVFGADADHFRPERWIQHSDGNKTKEMERHMYQFGGGTRLCIGRNLALLELNKLLPQLLSRYDFELVHPDRPLRYHTTFFVVQEGLEVLVRRCKS